MAFFPFVISIFFFASKHAGGNTLPLVLYFHGRRHHLVQVVPP